MKFNIEVEIASPRTVESIIDVLTCALQPIQIVEHVDIRVADDENIESLDKEIVRLTLRKELLQRETLRTKMAYALKTYGNFDGWQATNLIECLINNGKVLEIRDIDGK